MFYQGPPGLMVDLAKPSPNGLDLLYSDEYVAARMRMYANPYAYANNNPLRFVDPSGLAPTPIPVPPLPPGVCAGTDCDEKKGIVTNWTDKDDSCFHKCRKPITEAHEATHRKNMGPCCDGRNACLAKGAMAPDDMLANRLRAICQNVWNLWKRVARDELEVLAAVDSCNAAKKLIAGNTKDMECCDIARKWAEGPCKVQDPTAKIPCCPFNKDGSVDIACVTELNKRAREMFPPKK